MWAGESQASIKARRGGEETNCRAVQEATYSVEPEALQSSESKGWYHFVERDKDRRGEPAETLSSTEQRQEMAETLWHSIAPQQPHNFKSQKRRQRTALL